MSRSVYPEETRRKIVELHTRHKLGIKAIAKWFKGKPGKTTVERILREAGVYQGPERMAQQRRQTEDRRQRIIARERKWRHRMAVCLWNLRQGKGIERTCYEHGWNQKSIWIHLRERTSYRLLRDRLPKPFHQHRRYQRQELVSRLYPREELFRASIKLYLQQAGLEFDTEPKIADTRLRSDFRVQGYLLECKVDVTHGKLIHCIGQCCIYRHTGNSKPVVVFPDDVELREPFRQVFETMNVPVLHENQLPDWCGTLRTIQESSYRQDRR